MKVSGIAASAIALVSSMAPAATDQSWTLKNSIELRYIVPDPQVDGFTSDSYHPMVGSPNGEYFAFVTRHGELSTDTNVYDLYIYAINDVRAALSNREHSVPKPFRKVTLRSARSDLESSAIALLKWDGDDHLVFLGLDQLGRRAVYKYSVGSDRLERISQGCNGEVPLTASRLQIRAGSMLFQCTEREPWRPLNTYPMLPLQGAEMLQLAQGDKLAKGKSFVSIAYKNSPVRSISLQNMTFHDYGPNTISPDGKWALITPVIPWGQPTPSGWDQYELQSPHSFFHRPMLINLENGAAKVALDAPDGDVTKMGSRVHPNILWASDSRHVILINTALPLTPSNQERRRTAYVVSYDTQSDRYAVLEPMESPSGIRVKAVTWLREGQEILVQHEDANGKSAPANSYAWDGRTWKKHEQRAFDKSNRDMQDGALQKFGITLDVREGTNEPPNVYASDGKYSMPLMAPDPALESARRTAIEPFEWTEADGQQVRGGLLIPSARSGLKPPPLVIQTYKYDPGHFAPDGMEDWAPYAAQSLVAQGMVVAVIPNYDPRIGAADDTLYGMKPFVARVDAVVDELNRRGLIDPNRVGLIGFSTGAQLTYYTITHPGRTKLAAALVADGTTNSYFEYVASMALVREPWGADPGQMERLYGGKKFWDDKQAWLDAPGFNVEKVRTPVLFTAPGDGGYATVTMIMEALSAFRYLEKPMEYLFFPEGSHVLVRPKERQASMQAAVDWMNFWLQDKLPADTERATRWEAMRSKWVLQNKSTSMLRAEGPK